MFTTIGAVLGGLSLGLPALGMLARLKPFRRLILIGAAALAVVAATLLALAWHAGQVAAFGAERLAAGEAKVQAAWDKAVVDAERMRSAERRRAAEDLSMRELAQVEGEEADDERFRRLNADLERALAATRSKDRVDPDRCSVPGELLGPRRALGAE